MTDYVYRLWNRSHALLYVGIAGDVRKRWAGHIDKPWRDEVASTTTEPFASREAAATAERHAIETERPRCNRIYNSHRPAADPDRFADLEMPEVLERLGRVAEELATSRTAIATFIRCGAAAGISKTTLARTAKLSRRAVYDILEK